MPLLGKAGELESMSESLCLNFDSALIAQQALMEHLLYALPRLGQSRHRPRQAPAVFPQEASSVPFVPQFQSASH